MKKLLLFALCALVSLGFGGGSSTDPYIMPELPGYPAGNSNYGGRTQVSALPVGASTGVILVFGDSTGANAIDSIYTPTQALNQNFNVYNGGVYTSKEPLLGCGTNSANLSSGNVFTTVADYLIGTSATYTRVVLVPIANGGAMHADWAVGGADNLRFKAAKARLDAAGLTVTGIYSTLGPNDTNAGTSQASVTASLTSIISTIRGLWPTTPIFVPTHSIFALATGANVTNAQAAALNAGNFVYTGGNLDSLTSSANYWDNTHFNLTGRTNGAPIIGAAIAAHP